MSVGRSGTKTVAHVAPARHCPDCGTASPCVRASWERYEGIPSGKEYEYVCPHCGRKFHLEGLGRFVVAAIFCAFTGYSAWLWLPSGLDGDRFDLVRGGLCALASAGCALQSVFKLLARRRYPIAKGEPFGTP